MRARIVLPFRTDGVEYGVGDVIDDGAVLELALRERWAVPVLEGEAAAPAAPANGAVPRAPRNRRRGA